VNTEVVVVPVVSTITQLWFVPVATYSPDVSDVVSVKLQVIPVDPMVVVTWIVLGGDGVTWSVSVAPEVPSWDASPQPAKSSVNVKEPPSRAVKGVAVSVVPPPLLPALLPPVLLAAELPPPDPLLPPLLDGGNGDPLDPPPPDPPLLATPLLDPPLPDPLAPLPPEAAPVLEPSLSSPDDPPLLGE